MNTKPNFNIIFFLILEENKTTVPLLDFLLILHFLYVGCEMSHILCDCDANVL